MKKNLVLILAVAGAVIGVFVVRYYFLNSFQIMGWKLFWNNLSQLNFNMFKYISESATFGKCLLGFIIGGFFGAILGKILKK